MKRVCSHLEKKAGAHRSEGVITERCGWFALRCASNLHRRTPRLHLLSRGVLLTPLTSRLVAVRVSSGCIWSLPPFFRWAQTVMPRWRCLFQERPLSGYCERREAVRVREDFAVVLDRTL